MSEFDLFLKRIVGTAIYNICIVNSYTQAFAVLDDLEKEILCYRRKLEEEYKDGEK